MWSSLGTLPSQAFLSCLLFIVQVWTAMGSSPIYNGMFISVSSLLNSLFDSHVGETSWALLLIFQLGSISQRTPWFSCSYIISTPFQQCSLSHMCGTVFLMYPLLFGSIILHFDWLWFFEVFSATKNVPQWKVMVTVTSVKK